MHSLQYSYISAQKEQQEHIELKWAFIVGEQISIGI